MLEVRDAVNLLGLVQSKQITLKAEAFNIDAKVEFPEQGLDFGLLRVGEASTQRFTAGNQGKYPITCCFTSAKRSKVLFADILTLEPPEATLVPEESLELKVTPRATRRRTSRTRT